MLREGARYLFMVALALGFLQFGTAVHAEVQADDEKDLSETEITSPLLESPDEEETVSVELPLAESKVETHIIHKTSAGYRFFSFDGYGGRAARYDDLHSGPVFGGQYSLLGKNHKFLLDGSYLSDNDYNGDLTYDYMGVYRLHLRTESLFHNLDNLSVSFPPFEFPGPAGYYARPLDARSVYGIRVEQDLASARIKAGSYPIHLNLQYWRMQKDGASQLRFSDHAFRNTPNTVYSRAGFINWETHEGKIGFDAHLGYLDVIYDFTARQFINHASTPVDGYVARNHADLVYKRGAGSYEHNEVPDSKFFSHTVKLHTEQTGGIVTAASYTIGRRTNLSSLRQTSGANGLSDTLQTAAGDFVYTPCKEFSLAVRFRHQEIDRDTATLTALSFTPSTITANQGIDTQKDVISTVLSVRPVDAFTLKGEYRGEFIHRDNTDVWSPNGNNLSGVTLPENSERHRGTITLLTRFYKGLRLKARYSYTTVSQPEYGVSYDSRHEGQLLATYTLKDRIGATANYQVIRENNDSKSVAAIRNLGSVDIGRNKKSVSATASVWGNLLEGKLSLTGTAGLIRSTSDQQSLFSAILGPSTAVASNYTSQSLLYGITIALRPVDKLSSSLSLQQIRSYAEFDPTASTTVFTDGIKSFSSLKTVENTVSFSNEYQLMKHISCGLGYTFKEYKDERDSQFDGSVHSVIASLSAKW